MARTMPALAAMITEKYRRKYHLPQSRLANILCAVAMKNHRNGSHNPLAQFQRPITRDAYFESKLVATPLRLYDCAPITDGAAAIVLTAEERRAHCRHRQGTGPVSLRDRETLRHFRPRDRRRAPLIAWPALLLRTSIWPKSTRFTPFEIISNEDLGFSPRQGGRPGIGR